MGLMQGKLDGDTMVVMDAFALPVTGTETRVNAQNDANEFMIQYITSSPAVSPFLLPFSSQRTQYPSLRRSDDWRTLSAGTILILVTAAGSPVSIVRLK